MSARRTFLRAPGARARTPRLRLRLAEGASVIELASGVIDGGGGGGGGAGCGIGTSEPIDGAPSAARGGNGGRLLTGGGAGTLAASAPLCGGEGPRPGAPIA